MTEVDLSKIKVVVGDRKFMKSSKSWRVYLDLPIDNKMLAPVLTGMIEKKVKMVITCKDGMKIEVDPMFVCDVPTKGRRFQLVLETCYEFQTEKDNLGAKLTTILHEEVDIALLCTSGKITHAVGLQTPPVTSEAPSEIPRGSITDKSLKGLHVLFGNERFQEYLSAIVKSKTGETLEFDKVGVKIAFKKLCQVDSCVDLDEDVVRRYVNDFNYWINNDGQSMLEGGRDGG